MESKRGFYGFLIKTIILWVVLVIIFVVTIKNQEPSGNILQMLGICFGVGAIGTLVMFFSSRCPKCGRFFAMGPTQKERVVLAVNSTTSAKVKRGLITGTPKLDVTTKEKEIRGIKQTRFCLFCGYARIKKGK